jgi:nucleoside-diphosphate-sugar epimerase
MDRDMPKGLKLAITGGCGYIGGALALSLAAEHYEVTAIDSMMYGRVDLPGVRIVEADVRDRNSLRSALAGVDAVLHLAFFSLDGDYPHRATAHANDEGFRCCLEEAKRAGVRRFVFPSSCSVYGRSFGKEPLDETALLQPLTEYARAKIRCEQILLATTGIERVILRPATVFGRAPRQRLDLTINRYAVEAYMEGRICVYGADDIRPSIYIGDLVRLYRLCIEAPSAEVDGQIFNAAYDAKPLRDIARRVATAAGGAKLRCAQNSFESRSYHVSCNRVADLLGFRPIGSLEEGVAEIIADLATGHLRPPFQRREYSNHAA